MIPSFWKRRTHGYTKLEATDHWRSIAPAGWESTVMASEEPKVFAAKQGRSIATWQLHDREGKPTLVYLKRHYRQPWRTRLAALFFPRRAWTPGLQEWHHLQWATEHGFAVPTALAAGEYLLPDGQLHGFIAIQELQGMVALHEAIPRAYDTMAPGDFRQWKRQLIRMLAEMSIALHRTDHFHRDWYLCHFYIPENWIGATQFPAHEQMYVIDFHRLIHKRWRRTFGIAKDLGQLLYSSDLPGISTRDRLEFWALYRKSVRWPRWLRWLSIRKWRLYQRHDKPHG
ncbi:MAG: lipopolysaccharide kinase InaA family protein [Zavarzinella sp.]